jgi:hypothetical protein
MVVVLELLVEELEGRDVTIHFGWPTSSWVDRMVTGVFVHNLMRLPPRYPQLHFAMECAAGSHAVAAPTPVGEAALTDVTPARPGSETRS